ncbi:hypothetical protein [Ruania zhangjianzhongii]|uniref:hypothetical protein n=1 Tax=Ruania zhangjianzhongii TaxID=2603206 RepID=UPI0011C8555C|nr:hypothetical protein [Ruania zhangjianzhongii]
MDVWRITLAALRRWYILLPLLALTGWGAWTAGNGIQPEYEAQATIMLTPGTAATEVPNPYGGLEEANQAVGIVLNSTESRAQIVEQGLSTEYEVVPESRSTIMYFTVRADDPETAVTTGVALIDMVEAELTARQSAAEVPSSSQYGIDVLAPPSVLEAIYDGKLRVQAIIGILGASVALVVAVLFDDIVGLVRRRRRRRKARADELVDSAEEARTDDGAERANEVDPAEGVTTEVPSRVPREPDRPDAEVRSSRDTSPVGERS